MGKRDVRLFRERRERYGDRRAGRDMELVTQVREKEWLWIREGEGNRDRGEGMNIRYIKGT